MSNPYLVTELSVGHVLPNQWVVMAYCVTDRHGLLLCSFTNRDDTIDFATWAFANEDLRSTYSGHYYNHRSSNAMDTAWADFRTRVSTLHLLS
jgi:hypothetical protein